MCFKKAPFFAAAQFPVCKISRVNSLLRRNKLAFSQTRVASYLFDGTGYALVSNMERRGRITVVTRFDIEVRTVANDGILLLMVNGVIIFSPA